MPVERLLQAASIQERNPINFFFDYAYVRFLRHMARYIGHLVHLTPLQSSTRWTGMCADRWIPRVLQKAWAWRSSTQTTGTYIASTTPLWSPSSTWCHCASHNSRSKGWDCPATSTIASRLRCTASYTTISTWRKCCRIRTLKAF